MKKAQRRYLLYSIITIGLFLVSVFIMGISYNQSINFHRNLYKISNDNYLKLIISRLEFEITIHLLINLLVLFVLDFILNCIYKSGFGKSKFNKILLLANVLLILVFTIVNINLVNNVDLYWLGYSFFIGTTVIACINWVLIKNKKWQFKN